MAGLSNPLIAKSRGPQNQLKTRRPLNACTITEKASLCSKGRNWAIFVHWLRNQASRTSNG